MGVPHESIAGSMTQFIGAETLDLPKNPGCLTPIECGSGLARKSGMSIDINIG
jgi:hypothetical protein